MKLAWHGVCFEVQVQKNDFLFVPCIVQIRVRKGSWVGGLRSVSGKRPRKNLRDAGDAKNSVRRTEPRGARWTPGMRRGWGRLQAVFESGGIA